MKNSTSDWVKRFEAAKLNGLSDAEVADLTETYAYSGKTLSFEEENTADIASTGGPSSLSTLLTPLMLVAAGWIDPKLGVPGRPAGGLDVLAQIPGYRINLDSSEIRQILNQCGYAHFASSGAFAPLDAETFKIRQIIDAQTVPELVTASLLSKKFAIGVQKIGLDVRVAPHGNFGRNFSEAKSNAKRFIRVAKILDRSAICLLTDGTYPFQPFIGRGESLWALKNIFSGDADPWLLRHLDQCATMVSAITGKSFKLNLADLAKVFEENIMAQGGNIEDFDAKVESVSKEHLNFLNATASGRLTIDLGELRSVMTSIQQPGLGNSTFPDVVGVRLLIEPGQRVEKNEPIMSIRIPDTYWKRYRVQIENTVQVTTEYRNRQKDEIVDVG